MWAKNLRHKIFSVLTSIKTSKYANCNFITLLHILGTPKTSINRSLGHLRTYFLGNWIGHRKSHLQRGVPDLHGMTHIADIESMLSIFLSICSIFNNMKIPSHSRRDFYPSKMIIRVLINRSPLNQPGASSDNQIPISTLPLSLVSIAIPHPQCGE